MLAVLVARGEGGVAKFAVLFVVIPALLAGIAAARARLGRFHLLFGAAGAAALGAFMWGMTILVIASEGIYE